MRASRGPSAGFGRVQLTTADAVKRQLPPLGFEERMIAPIIVDPHPEEEREDEETVDNGAEGEIHASKTAARTTLGRVGNA
jgi:hypothetical protein